MSTTTNNVTKDNVEKSKFVYSEDLHFTYWTMKGSFASKVEEIKWLKRWKKAERNEDDDDNTIPTNRSDVSDDSWYDSDDPDHDDY